LFALVGSLCICAQGALAADTDGDSVPDAEDIDDDNDGILDVIEAGGLVDNGDFATDLTGWTSTGGWFRSGGGDARIEADSSIPASLSQTVTVLPDIPHVLTFTVGAYGAHDSNSYLRVYVDGVLLLTDFSDTVLAEAGGIHVKVPRTLSFTPENATTTIAFTAAATSFATSDDWSFDDVLIAQDTDADGLLDALDLDADNDGIPDMVEAQTSQDFLSPIGDTDNNGLDDAFESSPGAGEGLTPVNTDGAGAADFKDLDSDNDEIDDIVESGHSLTDADEDGRTDGSVGTNGLDDAIDSSSDYADPDGLVHDGALFALTDTDEDVLPDGSDASPPQTDFDYRDNEDLDTDGDGVPDLDDVDIDGDGITNSLENINGDFSHGLTNWTSTGGWAPAGGQARVETDASGTYTLSQTLTVEPGVPTTIHWTVGAYSGHNGSENMTVFFDGIVVATENTNDVHNWGSRHVQHARTHSYTPTHSTALLTFQVVIGLGLGDDFSIDNVWTDADRDHDEDGVPDLYDLDSDNDGIPDVVEAQTTADFITVLLGDSDQNGLDDAYESAPGAGEGLIPIDTTSSGVSDHVNLDSDADGAFDIQESGLGLTDANHDGRTDGSVGVNGLDDAAESSDSYADPTGLAHDGSEFTLTETASTTSTWIMTETASSIRWNSSTATSLMA
jgi:hypothetical protein